MGTDGLPQPSPPGGLFCCPCQVWEDPLRWEQHKAPGGKGQAAPRRQHRWRVDMWARKAQDCTSREAWLYSHYLQQGHLWLCWVLRSPEAGVGPGWASRLSIQTPQGDLYT